ncbi:ASCH domain-containing protein [Streptomyces sp. CBMA152]|uniref:ASCH domain-containing protein n=1 Tax=Streptomyces sp. CBMA152 TaxID=1896312 RepID=UPI0016605D80|nr:ASCH domain-containing protein [Streptomyces sp. CBMA152]MBD0741222.1 ASCH domain-containing protein [Streptomyces sp. CBMA152]
MWPRIDGLRVMELGTPGGFRDELNALVVAGKKRGTAGLLDEYRTEGEEIEHVGERLVVVDDVGERVVDIVVTGVEICRFGEVSWGFADSEGEGFRSVEEWREGHARYWGAQGIEVDPDTRIMCLSFRVAD